MLFWNTENCNVIYTYSNSDISEESRLLKIEATYDPKLYDVTIKINIGNKVLLDKRRQLTNNI